MPSDPTRASSVRRTQRRLTEEELKDIELKRIKGELSCAECRRLKLRCDKKVPCGSCCRRGCESICPCGILSAGQGTRFILADTDHLHKKIADMSHRIRQLEDALAILHATVSDERHPLMQDDLLKIKFGPEATESLSLSTTEVEQNVNQSIDALGTLTLDDSGEVKYFGRSAGSETLMLAGDDWQDTSDEDAPTEAIGSEFASLLTKDNSPKTLALLESHLPSPERARSLGESYLCHAASFFRPIKREELFESFMPAIYQAASANTNTPHALATMFFLFALGALLDLSLPPYSAEAEHFYELGRTALDLRTIYDSPQIDTVQALGLMATYHCLAGKKYSRDSAWCLMAFAAKLAQGLGLHRDSARWNMDAKTVQKRRTLFWEVFTADVSHCLALGRPPAMHLSYVDCEFPIDEEATLSDAGEIQNGFWRTKYTFGLDMFLAVADTTLVAKSPNYTTVLDLDRKIREATFPNSFKPYVSLEDGEEAYHSSSLSLQDFYASQHRTVTMIYLHRSFFAQAMLDHPSNPLLSPFAPSFLTAYRCASVIIKASAHHFDRCAAMAMRVWFLMYHTFSAAIIVGTVVTRSPKSNVASSALQDLTRAVELFERTARQSQRAKVALGVLQKIKEKALRAYTQDYTPSPNPSQPTGTTGTTTLASSSNHQKAVDDDGDDELAIFGGQTRVLSRKSRRRYSATSMPMGSHESPSPSVILSSSPTTMGDASRQSTSASLASLALSPLDVHPALLEYLGGTAIFRGAPGDSQQNNLLHDMGISMSPSTAVLRPSDTYAAPHPPLPAGGEGFPSFVANQAIPSPGAAGPSNTADSMTYPPYPQAQSQDSFTPDANGLPEPDNSFGWVPPSHLKRHQQHHRRPQQRTGSMVDVAIPASSGDSHLRMHDSPMQDQAQDQGGTTRSLYLTGGEPYHDLGYGHGRENMAMATDPPPGLVDLMEGSGIDSEWLSFIQDCGIMMESGSARPLPPPPHSDSAAPTSTSASISPA